MGLKRLISSWRDRRRRKELPRDWPPRPWPPPPPSIRRGDPVCVDNTGCVQIMQKADTDHAIGIAMNSAKKDETAMVNVDLGVWPRVIGGRLFGWNDSNVGGGSKACDRSKSDTFGDCIHLGESKWFCRKCKWLDICAKD